MRKSKRWKNLVPLVLYPKLPNTCCVGVTQRFHKTTFLGFFSERELVDFLHMLWRHFCQILLRTWKRILFYTYRNKLTNYPTSYILYTTVHLHWRFVQSTLHCSRMSKFCMFESVNSCQLLKSQVSKCRQYFQGEAWKITI